jgi:hypothetical protein
MTPVLHPDPEIAVTLKISDNNIQTEPLTSLYPRYNAMAFTTGTMGNISVDGGACFRDEEAVKGEVTLSSGILYGYPVSMTGSRSSELEEALLSDYQCHCWSCASPVGLKAELGQMGSGNATLSWDQFPCHEGFQGKIREENAQSFSTFISLTDHKEIKNLEPGTTYDWKLRARCTNKAVSPFSSVVSFSTWPATRMSDVLAELQLSPNPADESVRVDFVFEGTGELSLILHDFTGKLLREYNLAGNSGSFEIPSSDLSDGLYLLEIREGVERIGVEKFMVQH